MKNRATVYLVVACSAMILGCASIKVPLSSNYPLYELQVPSPNYAIGQVIEFDGYRKGIDIIYDPKVPNEAIKVSQIALDQKDKSEIAASLQGKIADVINASVAKLGDEKVQIDVGPARLARISKYDLYMSIVSDIKKNPELLNMLHGYSESGVRFDIIYQVKTTQVGLSIFEASGKIISLDKEVLKTINDQTGIQFQSSGENGKYMSQNVVIEIGYDARMVEALARQRE